MADPGPSSGRKPFMSLRRRRLPSPIPGVPFIGPYTPNFTSAMFASSAPTQPGAIMAPASTDAMESHVFDGIQVTAPSSQANGVLSARIDTRIELRLCFHPDSPVQFLKIPKTPSVHGECPTPAGSWKFSLELKGVGSPSIIRNVCENCKERKDQATWDIVDFRAPTTIVSIQDRTASVEFFIKCYAHHHGITNFCADAVLQDYQDNVIDRVSLPLLFNISGKGKQPVKPKRAQKRAVRGVTAQQHIAPRIIPTVPLSVGPSAQDPQHVDNGTVQELITSHMWTPAGDNLQTSTSDQQSSWAGTTTKFLPVPDPFLWFTSSTPFNAPPLISSTSQHVVRLSELGFSSHDMDSGHHVDSLPLESNSNPIPPVMSRENAPVPRSLGPTSGEPHCGMNQSSRVPAATSQMLSQNSSDIPRPLNTSSAVPSGQGASIPDVSTPSEASRLQMESPANTRNEGINQNTGETLLEEVVPGKGRTTGKVDIVLFGENFPSGPLYVGFGDNWTRARRRDARTLRCCLPPSASPGVVNVTLSQTPSKDEPEVGWSTVTFEYEENRPETTSQHAVKLSELEFDSHDMDSGHHVDSLPLESNSNPVDHSGTRISASPIGEQIPPVMSCENLSVPRSLGPTPGEPHCGYGINQSLRVPEATSQMMSQNSSGISRPLNTSSAVPSGQGPSIPDVSTPPEVSRLQMESPAHTRNEGINQNTGETLLQEADPEKGPMTGGIRIALFGRNFPAVRLFVGFGNIWVRARRHDAGVLRCRLPPSNRPGVVDVTISQTPSEDAPEVGWSTATFEYEDSRVEALLSMLKTFYQWANEAIRQMKPVQSFDAMKTHHHPSLNMNTSHSNNQGREELPPRLEEENIEDISIYFLCTYSTHSNWKEIVSTCNDYGQTLAHLAVTLGYFRLLQHLFRWQIDLNVVDSMGLSALHYAYLFKQEECAKFLIHSGVDRFILDDLGRSPSDLDPSLEVKLHSIADIDSNGHAEGASPIEYDTEIQDEAKKLYAKRFLIQQWMRQGEDERRGEVPPSRCQNPDTLDPPRSAGSRPALDFAGERDRGVTYDHSPPLGVRIPAETSTLIVTEEMNSEPSIEIAALPHTALPPPPISAISSQTQEAHQPSDNSPNLISRPAPLGGTVNPPDFEHLRIYRGTDPFADSGLSTAKHVLPDTSASIEEQNDANTAGVAVTSGVRFASFSPSESLVEGRRMRELLSSYKGISIDEGVSPSISDHDASDLGDTSSPPPKQGVIQSRVQLDFSNASLHRNSSIPPATLIDLNSLFDARLQATGPDVERIDFIVDFVGWISRSDFHRFQQPEPIIGRAVSTNYPAAVEELGIKGQSVYTALFHHLDMVTFACKLCTHVVEDDLEAAICHQRVEHFGHYPYRCMATHTQCGQRFASQAQLEVHQSDTGH